MNTTNLDMFKKQFNCEYDEEGDYFTITWEDKNSELIYKENDRTLEKINIDDDYPSNYRNKNNMFWIEDIKKHYNWKIGDCIYLNMKQNYDNAFYVMRGWGDPYERKEDLKSYDVAIDEDGFVIKRFYQLYSTEKTKNIKKYDFVARTNCLYNDYWSNIRYTRAGADNKD
jgi:hypothetical protein